MPEKESIAIIVRVNYGSVHEPEKLAGMAHLLEHCVLGRTRNRSNFEISLQVDSIGAYLNGHTTKNATYYEFKGLKKYLDFGLEILSDCLFNCTLDKKTMNGEKSIIFSELNRLLDDHEDYIVVECEKELFKNHPLGREIIGSKKTLNEISQKNLKSAWQNNYTLNNMELMIAGNVTENAAKKFIEKHFPKKSPKTMQNAILGNYTNFAKNVIKFKKPITQTLYCIGYPIEKEKPEKTGIYKLILLNSILVDGLSSRLYQEIREKRKLAYFVRSNLGRGSMESYTVVVGLEEKNLELAKKILKKELKKIAGKETTAKELATNKNKSIVEMKLLKEDNLNYVRVLSSLSDKKIKTIDEITKGIERVTAKELKEYAKNLFKDKNSTEVEIISKK